MVDADKVNESAAAPGMALVDEVQKADGAEGNEAGSGISGAVESIPKDDEGQDAEKGSTMEEDDSPAAAEEAPTILVGKRQRKSVEQWEPEVSKKRKSFEDVEVLIPQGRGTPLGDIPFLKEAISQNKDFELLGLAHRFVFGTKGRAITPKGYKQVDLFRSHLYKFSGYLPVAGDDTDKDKLEKLESEQEEKYTDRAGKMPKDTLLEVCSFFCINVTSSSSKETVMQRILDFLGSPDAKLLKQPVEKKPKGKPRAKGKRNSKGSSKEKAQEDAGDDEAVTETDSEGDEPKKLAVSKRKEAQTNNKPMPSDAEIKEWIKAYVACFDLKQATTSHAVGIAQDKFGVDFSEKKELFKKLLTEEVLVSVKEQI